jgi:serine/threonine protein kinase
LVHDNYIIVLQYANQGNLKEYLKKNFTSLQWKNKIQMALNITCGLKYLHFRKIIHRDLVMHDLYLYYIIWFEITLTIFFFIL